MKERIEKLKSLLDKLSDKDRSFAKNLIYSYGLYGHLTVGQTPYVDKLIERAEKPKGENAEGKIMVGNFSGVVTLFVKARQHLKYPKIVLNVGEQKVVLSLAGNGSKYPGSINITDGQPFGQNKWFGRVSPDGVWTQSSSSLTGLKELLEELASNPAEVATKYGKLSGSCCFCNAKLTDKRSVTVGYGPVCADHFGLKTQWETAWKNAQTVPGGETMKYPTQQILSVSPNEYILNLSLNQPTTSSNATYQFFSMEGGDLLVSPNVTLSEKIAVNTKEIIATCPVCDTPKWLVEHEEVLICQDCKNLLVLA